MNLNNQPVKNYFMRINPMKLIRRIERTAAIWIIGGAMMLMHIGATIAGSLIGAAVLTYKTWKE